MKKIILSLTVFLLIGITYSSFGQSENYLKNRIILEGTYIRNLGDFSNTWDNATGAYLTYGIAFPEHNFLMFRIGFLSNSLNNNLKDSVNYNDATLTIVPLEIGGRYYFTNTRFMPFVQFINGLNLVFENTDLSGEPEERTLVKYAWQVGFGLAINLLSNLNFDASVNYQSNFYETDAMNTGFEYAFGIGYALGD